MREKSPRSVYGKIVLTNTYMSHHRHAQKNVVVNAPVSLAISISQIFKLYWIDHLQNHGYKKQDENYREEL